MDASGGRLVGEATGEVEVEDGVLVIKRIHVAYTLRLDPDADRAKVQRAYDHHAERCPVYRSIGSAIEITTALELLDA
ncbi:MAG: OsmC family protein [Actinobacteria bacterium]|nr:OsmC family protein [Actinomycetota bacterium]